MRILVAISHHGFGHTTQVAPVVNALLRAWPGSALTLYTTVLAQLLRNRFAQAFEHVPVEVDVGMSMASSVDVLPRESAQRYRAFHASWEDSVAEEAARLRALAPDLIVANVPYRILAAAKQADIPAVAFSSLNWADIFRHYCGDEPGAQRIYAQMQAAYREAGAFMRPEPSLPMADLGETVAVGPVASVGHDRRAEIRDRLGIGERERLVLVAPGGIPMPAPMAQWPRIDGVRWLVQADWHVAHPDAMALESLGMPFVDVLRGSDALVGKPGYGTVAECACNGVPFVYVKRGDWPEEPYLLDWFHRHGRGAQITREDFARGNLTDALADVFQQPAPTPPTPTGVAEAARWIQGWVG